MGFPANLPNPIDKEHPLMGAVICFTSVPPERRVRVQHLSAFPEDLMD